MPKTSKTPRKKRQAKPNPPASVPIVRTSAGLRDAIFDEIDSIRAGTSNPTRANAVAKLAAGVVETVRMEIEVHRHLRQNAGVLPGKVNPNLGSPLELGSPVALPESNDAV
jgi:hypothetical protein